MLVLSLKKGEQVHLGGDITVKVLELSSGKVRVGIDASSELAIWRDSKQDLVESRSKDTKESKGDKLNKAKDKADSKREQA